MGLRDHENWPKVLPIEKKSAVGCGREREREREMRFHLRKISLFPYLCVVWLCRDISPGQEEMFLSGLELWEFKKKLGI